MDEDFDAVIIGSGAGGAPIAYELSQAGKRVLVLEKGALLRTQDERAPGSLSDFKRDEMFNVGPERIINIPNVPGLKSFNRPFYASHIEPDLNDEPHVFTERDKITGEERSRITIEGYTAQVVGGGTQLYGAVSLRFSDLDFRLRSFNEGRDGRFAGLPSLQHVRDWPFSYADLEKYYAKAEELLGINGTVLGQAKAFSSGSKYQTPLDPNPISEWARAGMEDLGCEWYRTPLAVITQDHAPSGRKAGWPKVGYVNRYGDPLGFKSNTWVALLRPAIREGWPITLRANSVVTHLQSNHGKVTRVHYRDPGGRPRTAMGKIVVVACSAIESVRLLMLSAEEDRMGFGKAVHYQEQGSLLGRFFLTHAFGGAEVAVKGHRYDKTLSLDSDYATDHWARQPQLDAEGMWAGGAIYNNTSDQSLPITLARTDGSTDLDTFWQGFAAAADKRGEQMLKWFHDDFGTRLSVSFMANQVPRWDNRIELHPVRDKWNRRSAHILKDWDDEDRHVMERLADACQQILLRGVPDVKPDEIGFGSVYGNAVRIANHILGGMRIGTDRKDSVLDPQCKMWDLDNLYVTDGSFMPTSGGANPTLTIQANAFRVAEHLLTILR